jgi:hypothetical protein
MVSHTERTANALRTASALSPKIGDEVGLRDGRQHSPALPVGAASIASPRSNGAQDAPCRATICGRKQGPKKICCASTASAVAGNGRDCLMRKTPSPPRHMNPVRRARPPASALRRSGRRKARMKSRPRRPPFLALQPAANGSISSRLPGCRYRPASAPAAVYRKRALRRRPGTPIHLQARSPAPQPSITGSCAVGDRRGLVRPRFLNRDHRVLCEFQSRRPWHASCGDALRPALPSATVPPPNRLCARRRVPSRIAPRGPPSPGFARHAHLPGIPLFPPSLPSPPPLPFKPRRSNPVALLL